LPATTIEPVGDTFIVEPDQSEGRTAAGILLPEAEAARRSKGRGKVLAIGPGPYAFEGQILPMPQAKVGDEIVYNANLAIRPDGQEGKLFHIVPAKNVCGIVRRRTDHSLTATEAIAMGKTYPQLAATE
jgi:co-chaperonin GroES (HSP10)